MHLVDAVAVFTTLLLVIDITAIVAALTNDNRNYFQQPPNIQLPYWSDLPIPYNVPNIIEATPTLKTKVISLVTKYVYSNPVCVKAVKKKTFCKKIDESHQMGFADLDKLITKEYFIEGPLKRGQRMQKNGYEDDNREFQGSRDETEEREDIGSDEISILASEVSRSSAKQNLVLTPALSRNRVHDMLIEDRLDQLETLLPHYTRRRNYETSTVTVTRTLSNRRAQATLIPKNCVPQGFTFCKEKKKKRESKIAKYNNETNEMFYFG